MQTNHWDVNEDTRKYHYWRGFRASLVLTVPVIAFLMVCAYVLAMNA